MIQFVVLIMSHLVLSIYFWVGLLSVTQVSILSLLLFVMTQISRHSFHTPTRDLVVSLKSYDHTVACRGLRTRVLPSSLERVTSSLEYEDSFSIGSDLRV